MKELLANPAVQTALVLAIVTALNAAVAWLKQKFPTSSARVEANWCYLQPVVEAAVAAAKAELAKSEVVPATISNIISKAVDDFAASYKLFEGKDASSAELAAARNEIAATVSRATEA